MFEKITVYAKILHSNNNIFLEKKSSAISIHLRFGRAEANTAVQKYFYSSTTLFFMVGFHYIRYFF